MIDMIITHLAAFGLGLGVGVVYGTRVGVQEILEAFGLQIVPMGDDDDEV